MLIFRIIPFVLLFLPGVVFAQSPEILGIKRMLGNHFSDPIHAPIPSPILANDWESVNTLEIEQKISDKLDFGVNLQNRLHNNFSQIKANLVEISLQRKITKSISVKSAYRLGLIPLRDWFGEYLMMGTQNRLMAAAYYKWKPKRIPFRLQLRTRFETEKNSIDFRQYNFFRFRVKASSKIGQYMKPYLSAEQFRAVGAFAGLRIARLEVGSSFKLFPNSSCTAFYRREHTNSIFSNTINAVGLSWKYQFTNMN